MLAAKLVTSLWTCTQPRRGKEKTKNKKDKQDGRKQKWVWHCVILGTQTVTYIKLCTKTYFDKNIKTVPCHQNSKLTEVSAEPYVNIESILHNNSFMWKGMTFICVIKSTLWKTVATYFNTFNFYISCCLGSRQLWAQILDYNNIFIVFNIDKK